MARESSTTIFLFKITLRTEEETKRCLRVTTCSKRNGKSAFIAESPYKTEPMNMNVEKENKKEKRRKTSKVLNPKLKEIETKKVVNKAKATFLCVL
ncbi:hypothetical protein HHI36_010796 [Cryptolaemus montrouzieri]|uniref:Uncharacterized protein n=1 Tax=Cryptolaemus montrouzieri TaxID=559131 RepID=A0ABD2MJW0_9CUCU